MVWATTENHSTMRLARLLLPALTLLAIAGAAAHANAAEFYTEDLRIPMAAAGPQGLEAFLVRPAASKRYPLALLSHGTPRDFDDRATMSAGRRAGCGPGGEVA